jgi:hypothetical protein
VYRATASDSESDGYVNAKKNIPTKKERQRLLLVAEGRLPPSRNEVRFSARRTAQVTNYNEEGEDSFEEEEEETTPNYWASTTEADNGPIIDKILDHRPKEGTGNGTRNDFWSYTKQHTELDPFYAGKQDFEYLVSTPHISMQYIDLTNALDQMARQGPLSLHLGGLSDRFFTQRLAKARQLFQRPRHERHVLPWAQEDRTRRIRATHGCTRGRAREPA